MTSTSFFDAPGGIRKEGNSQTLTFTRTSPTTGVVCWTPVPPVPAGGCGTPGHYRGGVLIGNTSPIEQLHKPTDGTCCYKADPTFDPMLFAGDFINGARVLWSDNNDLTTSCVTVEGLDGNCTAYYFAFFAEDGVCRYNQDGIYSYSLNHGGPAIECIHGKQTIMTGGVNLADPIPATIDKTINYPIQMIVDGATLDLTIRGNQLTTYQSVIDELANAWKYTTAPIVSQYPPLYGNFYTDGAAWYQYNGVKYNQVYPILSATDPTNVVDGDLWVEYPSGRLMESQNQQWVPVSNVVVFPSDPTIVAIGQYWYDGVAARKFDGTIWIPNTSYIQATDPSIPKTMTATSIWQNGLTFSKWNISRNRWLPLTVLTTALDITNPVVDMLWFDQINSVLTKWNGTDWLGTTATVSATQPTGTTPNELWVDTTNKRVMTFDLFKNSWSRVDSIFYHKDPFQPIAGDLYYNTTTKLLFTYDDIIHNWVDVTTNVIVDVYDPTIPPTIADGALWYNSTNKLWMMRIGSNWQGVNVLQMASDPRSITTGYWCNTSTMLWYQRNGNVWNQIHPSTQTVDPANPLLGTTWYDGTTLYQRNTTTTWVSVPFTTTPAVPTIGSRWLDLNGTLKMWSGTAWVELLPPYTVSITANDNIVVTSASCGSESYIDIRSAPLFSSLLFTLCTPIAGNDGTSGVPMYDALGIGTDGSVDERRKIIDNLYMRLGFPTIAVELDRNQMDLAVQKGLDLIRRDSGAGYSRGYFPLDLQPGQQQYVLTSKAVGFNKIVDILYLYRSRGSFLSSVTGSDMFAQQMLQQLYVAGTFDILSYHLVASYQTVVSKMFATELQFNWTERTRTLTLQRRIIRVERILVDATIERTEQDLLTDRMTKTWIENWAMSEAKIMLGDMRGKYGSLPGAGGSITLNADALKADAAALQERLLRELDDYNASDIETWGLGGSIARG